MDSLVVGDADVLVALVLEEDPHHKKVVDTITNLMGSGIIVVFPNTAILEAVTTLKRSLNQPQKAHLLVEKYLKEEFVVEYVNENIQRMASPFFNEKAISKKNTIFDATVVTVAKSLNCKTIFSFDGWYTKLGFKLASDLF